MVFCALLVKLEGEKVLNVQPHIGYIHSGIEKMTESLTYLQIPHLTDRMDYLAAHMNNEAVSLCVLKKHCKLKFRKEQNISVPFLMNFSVLPLISYGGVHSVWIWVHLLHSSMDLRDREDILDIFEKTCGARSDTELQFPWRSYV
jgi:NADH-quinone oxidoreductase subunit D